MKGRKQEKQTNSLAKEPESKTTPESELKEINGRKGPEPTRYGDWEKNGRCIDF